MPSSGQSLLKIRVDSTVTNFLIDFQDSVLPRLSSISTDTHRRIHQIDLFSTCPHRSARPAVGRAIYSRDCLLRPYRHSHRRSAPAQSKPVRQGSHRRLEQSRSTTSPSIILELQLISSCFVQDPCPVELVKLPWVRCIQQEANLVHNR